MCQNTHQEDKLVTVHGLADAFGLSTLEEYQEDEISPFIMKATIYRFRHCLYFQAQMDEPLASRLKSLMEKNKRDEALNLLKERANVISIPEEFLDSWELIPDQRLDPYRSYVM